MNDMNNKPKTEDSPREEVECKSMLAEEAIIETECRFCHYTNVSDHNFYSCQCCGAESCTDCGGRCGCEQEDPS